MAAKKAMKRRKAKKMPMKLQNAVFTELNAIPGFTGAGTNSYYINAAHLMSMLNRKAFHQVDSRGYVKNYGLQIQVFNMVNATSFIHTASQGYPMENAVKAWSDARKERYADAGFKLSDLGYGARLRFGLDKTMTDLNQSTSTSMIRPSHLSSTVADKGEWDFSDVIITPPVLDQSTSLEGNDLFDSFVLHLTGDHTEETGAGDETVKFTHVGMIQSWTQNTRGWATPDSTETVQPENPLAFARASSPSSGALTNEVSDEQKQSPPYSNVDDDTAESVFAELVLQGQIESAFPNPTTNDDIVVAPGGVAKLTITNNDSSAAYPLVSIRIFEL
jgi:hypothetical protein